MLGDGIVVVALRLVREGEAGKVKQKAEGADGESRGTGSAGPGRVVIIRSLVARCLERP